jgi:hypothetical protein
MRKLLASLIFASICSASYAHVESYAEPHTPNNYYIVGDHVDVLSIHYIYVKNETNQPQNYYVTYSIKMEEYSRIEHFQFKLNPNESKKRTVKFNMNVILKREGGYGIESYTSIEGVEKDLSKSSGDILVHKH